MKSNVIFSHINNNQKDHTILSIAIGMWLVFFLIFIAPFDIIELNFNQKIFLVPPYAIFFIISYYVAYRIQLLIFAYKKSWNVGFEFIVIAIICLINLGFTYLYYTSSFLNGDFSIYLFIKLIYTPIVILIGSLLILGRLFISYMPKDISKIKSDKKLVIRGDNKNDTLIVNPKNIIVINSAQNYVEVVFKLNDQNRKHLIRSSFKKIVDQIPFLVQTHRSHCINPEHLSNWIDNKTLLVDQIEVPVSKTYKNSILNHMNPDPN